MSDSHSHTNAGAHDVAKHVRTYLVIGAALLAGTALTVGMYYVHFQSVTLTITIALIIATVKASLVAGFFMHLISEKTVIYTILMFTVFFFAAMMALTIYSKHNVPEQTVPSVRYAPAAVQHVP